MEDFFHSLWPLLAYPSLVADHADSYSSSDGCFQQDDTWCQTGLLNVHTDGLHSPISVQQSTFSSGGKGNSHHGCAAHKCGATVWCYHANMDVSRMLLSLWHEELRQLKLWHRCVVSLNICEGAVLIFPSLSAAAVSVLFRCHLWTRQIWELFLPSRGLAIFFFEEIHGGQTPSVISQSLVNLVAVLWSVAQSVFLKTVLLCCFFVNFLVFALLRINKNQRKKFTVIEKRVNNGASVSFNFCLTIQCVTKHVK